MPESPERCLGAVATVALLSLPHVYSLYLTIRTKREGEEMYRALTKEKGGKGIISEADLGKGLSLVSGEEIEERSSESQMANTETLPINR